MLINQRIESLDDVRTFGRKRDFILLIFVLALCYYVNSLTETGNSYVTSKNTVWQEVDGIRKRPSTSSDSCIKMKEFSGLNRKFKC
jgi:hypothetical protein